MGNLPDLLKDLHDLLMGRRAGIGSGTVVGQGGGGHIVQGGQVLGLGELGAGLGDLGGDAHFGVHEVEVGDQGADGGDLVHVAHAEDAGEVAVLADAGGVFLAGAACQGDAAVEFDDVGQQDGVGAAEGDVEAGTQLMDLLFEK